ncbi:hypothetical protein [Methylorubrum salsuginis]|uniref:hypothetical protein n=1 Tax=Methylorubrum salsuginis TaxID=414703 RepID=UPI001041F7F5|nr:hypothetical protein [Methylorubrum salsuginis]
MSKATLADIAACFRIILGREPSSEEVGVHTRAHLGNDLADVLKSYLESEEFRGRQIVQVIKSQPERLRAVG